MIEGKVVLENNTTSEGINWFLEKSLDNKRYVFKSGSGGGNFVLGVDGLKLDSYNKENPPPIELNYDNGAFSYQWILQFQNIK